MKETGLGHEIKIRKNNLQLTDISIANIVTNSYMLRPLNRDFISKMRPFNSVITLMYEAWEMRYADIDINACDQLGIKVCGVSETTKMLPIFDFCGPMIAKLVFDAGFEIMSNNIVIFSNDSFGKVAKKTFKALGAASVTLTNDLFAIPNVLEKADFLLLADYKTVKPLLETSGCAPINFLNKYNPELNIIHLFGEISEHEVKLLKGRIFPETSGLANMMTYNLSSCGEIPVFWLQVAGLKAAQEVLEGGPIIFSQDITSEI